DAFVDGVDHQLARLARGDAYRQGVTRLHFRRCVQHKVDGTQATINIERHHRHTHRLGKNILVVEAAHERNVDIGVGFQSFWHADGLHGALAVGGEPLVRKYLVTFDGDQAGTLVGRGDLHLDLVASLVVVTVELDLQLGIFFQVGGKVATADHAERLAGHYQTFLVDQFDDKVAGLVA